MRKSASRKTKPVEFQITAEPGSQIFVAGTFNDWDPARHPMRDNPHGGLFKTTVALPAGRHEYKFVVNGEWQIDPNCPDWHPNGLGSLNSVVAV